MKKVFDVIEFVQHGKTEYIDPNADLAINVDNLAHECSTQPSYFAFYASLLADLENLYIQSLNRKRQYEAEMESEMRSRIVLRFGPNERLTEAKLESEFYRDPTWNQLQNEVNDNKLKVAKVQCIVDALKQRAQQLWNVVVLHKEENKNINYSAENK